MARLHPIVQGKTPRQMRDRLKSIEADLQGCPDPQTPDGIDRYEELVWERGELRRALQELGEEET